MTGNVTKNITWTELASRDGAPVPPELEANAREVARRAQVVRDFFDAPILIRSGYRTAEHNKAVGGAKESQHLTASAIDFNIKGVAPADVRRAIEGLIRIGALPDGGLGAYDTFTHLDIRKTHARWSG